MTGGASILETGNLRADGITWGRITFQANRTAGAKALGRSGRRCGRTVGLRAVGEERPPGLGRPGVSGGVDHCKDLSLNTWRIFAG